MTADNEKEFEDDEHVEGRTLVGRGGARLVGGGGARLVGGGGARSMSESISQSSRNCCNQHNQTFLPPQTFQTLL